jgi:hypothetical protein
MLYKYLNYIEFVTDDVDSQLNCHFCGKLSSTGGEVQRAIARQAICLAHAFRWSKHLDALGDWFLPIRLPSCSIPKYPTTGVARLATDASCIPVECHLPDCVLYFSKAFAKCLSTGCWLSRRGTLHSGVQKWMVLFEGLVYSGRTSGTFYVFKIF